MVSLQSMNSRGQSQPVYRAALTKRKISGTSPGTHLVKPWSRAWLFSNDAGRVTTYMDFIGYNGKRGQTWSHREARVFLFYSEARVFL